MNKFQRGDRVIRVGEHVLAPGRPPHGDAECRKGEIGIVESYYDEPGGSQGGLMSVSWDKGNGSAIHESCMELYNDEAEVQAAIDSILKGASHG